MLEDSKGPILHVLVIGFHHKKGCQVEYSYPPLLPSSSTESHETPAGWKYLPTLALPDGSHNYDKDTVFFHLPSLESPDETVFGISCFRQIPVEKLKVRTPDMTRGTVQKAVCVLSTVPLYGQIQVKMELITHAYFDEGDFNKVGLLKDTYTHLNACIEQMGDLHSSSQLFVGLSARELILALRHKVLLLYKLLLLEKKVLFFQSPVHPLCSSILSLLSLHPGMIEKGLSQAACFKPSRPMSPVPHFTSLNRPANPSRNDEAHNGISPLDNSADADTTPSMLVVSPTEPIPPQINLTAQQVKEAAGKPEGELSRDGIVTVGREVKEGVLTPVSAEELKPNGREGEDGQNEGNTLCNGIEELDVGDTETAREAGSSLSRDPSMDMLVGDASYQAAMATLMNVDHDTCALPLSIFTEGYLCLPYLSLPYMDVLIDPNIRGYILGATNVLFKQKKNVADVIIELETGIIETSDPELRKMLHLSTEDLRFGEYLDRRTRNTEDAYIDGVGWEGGGDWIRSQFHAYTIALLRTSLLPEGSKEMDQFNRLYMAAFMETNSYRRWREHPEHTNILEAFPGHPFAGQLSVADMKLRLAHTMQTTEGGRKLNQAMASTGRVVATTGRAVGGALSQAKGALSNWWSNFTTPPPPPDIPTAEEACPDDDEYQIGGGDGARPDLPNAEVLENRLAALGTNVGWSGLEANNAYAEMKETQSIPKTSKQVESANEALSETGGAKVLQV